MPEFSDPRYQPGWRQREPPARHDRDAGRAVTGGWRADLDPGEAGRSWPRPRRPGAADIVSALSRPVKPGTGPGWPPSRPGGHGGVLVPAAAQRDGDDASRDSAVGAGSVCGRRLAAADHTEISPIAAYREPAPCAAQAMNDAATPKYPERAPGAPD
jgi:hypothetical protein